MGLYGPSGLPEGLLGNANLNRRGGPYLTLRSAFRGGLPEGQFKIHPLLNYVVFRVPGQLLGGFPVK